MTQILSVGGASVEFPQRSSWRRQLHGSLRNHGASHGLRSRELCLARDKRWRILQQGTIQEAKHTSSQSMNNLSTVPRPAPLPELDWKLQWYLPWTERTSQWEVQMTLRHDWQTIPNNKYSRLSLLDCSQIASSSSPEHLGWRWRRCFWCQVIIQLVAKASPHKIPSKQNEKQFLASWRYSCSTIATQLPNLCTMCTFYDIVQTIDASLHNSPVCLLHTVVINVKNVHVQDNAVCTWEFCTTSPVCTRGGVPCRLTRDKLNPSHSLFSIAPTKARCLHWGSLKGAIMHNCTKWTTPVHKYSYKCFDLGVLHKIDRSFELTRLNVQILNIRQYSVLIIKYIILYRSDFLSSGSNINPECFFIWLLLRRSVWWDQR